MSYPQIHRNTAAPDAAFLRPHEMRYHRSMADYAEVRLRGQDMPLAKLTDLDVIDIRSRYRQRLSLEKYIRENLSQVHVAKMYGISLTTLQGIQTYKTWKHLV